MTSVGGVVCRVATDSDLDYIVDLEYRNKESLGFLPKMAIAERVLKGQLFLGLLNGEPFGYLLFDVYPELVVVRQACIQYDARRRLYGAALYGWALSQWDTHRVRLNCAADLESNLFWQSLGLVCVAVKDGGKRRGRKINVWCHFLTDDILLFSPGELMVTPAFQRREDCRDQETGFLLEAPLGFIDHGSLGKLAWSNRK